MTQEEESLSYVSFFKEKESRHIFIGLFLSGDVEKRKKITGLLLKG